MIKKAKKRSVKSPIKTKDVIYFATGKNIPSKVDKQIKEILDLSKKHNNLVVGIAVRTGESHIAGKLAAYNSFSKDVKALTSKMITEFDLVNPELVESIKKAL